MVPENLEKEPLQFVILKFRLLQFAGDLLGVGIDSRPKAAQLLHLGAEFDDLL
jgi:hypothetical protein